MSVPFQQLTLAEFAGLLDRFPFDRQIHAVHLHHTGRPNHAEFRGQETLVAMRRVQTQAQGWGDIAQHVTVDPNGAIWTGRNWNLPPVSAAGHNGNRTAGPFMVVAIGDFTLGRDRFAGAQRDATLRIIALIQQRFGLSPETLAFHTQLSTAKSCPGTALDHRELIGELRVLHAVPGDARAMPGQEDGGAGPFGDEALAIRGALRAIGASLPERDDPFDAEPLEDAMADAQLRELFGGEDAARAASPGPNGARGVPIPPEILDTLRPHVINLNLGRFSEDGQFATAATDVDAIFDEHLPRALEGAKAAKRPLRLLFYAHGGLVQESAGLRIAEKHVSWWRANDVYPLYFVWETGLYETIGQLLGRSRQAARAATRDIFDFTTDPVIEELARALHAPRIWSGMKRSAERAVAPDGGALYVARKLQAFCDRHKDERIELHAVGHSAGSIFHAHFLPAALDLGVPAFRSVQFLAPAIRADAFHRQLADRLGAGKGIAQLTIFTMTNTRERADNCNGIYHKSLLYLIYHALEAEPKTPILGLEISLRGDPHLRALFGLGGRPPEAGEVVWSPTTLESGRRASWSTTHGGFDDDAPTMNSVARRVLGADDNDPIADFPAAPAGGRALGSWEDQVDWPAGFGAPFAPGVVMPGALPAAPPPVPGVPGLAPAALAGVAGATMGRRRALCVGINAYPTARLYGCIADAQAWQATLAALGFDDITLLVDQQATRDGILQALRQLVATSRAGDVAVFQFAGHGTQLPDPGGDEAGEDTPDQDEAICPIDFAGGAFVIDDDIGAIFDQIPRDVNLTCFIDCCHSGTISRFGVGAPSAAGGGPRPRFLVATPAMVEAHRRFRQGRGARQATGTRGLSTMREVLFAACLSSEVAYEEGGHGDFTARATRLLQAGLGGLTNEQFEKDVVGQFGAAARQHPRLYCHPDARPLGLLQPLTGGGGAPPAGAGNHASRAGLNGQSATVAQLLRLATALVEGRD